MTIISTTPSRFPRFRPQAYFARGAFGSVSNPRFPQLQTAHWWHQQACGHTTFPARTADVQGIKSLQGAPSLENCSQRLREPRRSSHLGCSRPGGIQPPPQGSHMGHVLWQSALRRQQRPRNKRSVTQVFFPLLFSQCLANNTIKYPSVCSTIYFTARKQDPLTSPLLEVFLVLWLLTHPFCRDRRGLDKSSPPPILSLLFLGKQWSLAARRQNLKPDRQGSGKDSQFWIPVLQFPHWMILSKSLHLSESQFTFLSNGLTKPIKSHGFWKKATCIDAEALEWMINILVPFEFLWHGTELSEGRKVKGCDPN